MKQRTILIVDDNPQIRHALNAIERVGKCDASESSVGFYSWCVESRAESFA